jgi:hypothetical protein
MLHRTKMMLCDAAHADNPDELPLRADGVERLQQQRARNNCSGGIVGRPISA